MIWFSIIGIVLFLIILYIVNHTHEDRSFDYEDEVYKYEEEDKFHLAIWQYLCIAIGCLVPVVNLIIFFTFTFSYFLALDDNEIYFKSTGIVKKIFDFLSKEV